MGCLVGRVVFNGIILIRYGTKLSFFHELNFPSKFKVKSSNNII